jgi:hypothetical protein
MVKKKFLPFTEHECQPQQPGTGSYIGKQELYVSEGAIENECKIKEIQISRFYTSALPI